MVFGFLPVNFNIFIKRTGIGGICPGNRRDQFGRNLLHPQLFCLFKRITESSFFIYNQYAVRTEPGDFFLSGQSLQKVIHHDNKADGGSFLSEVLQKIVITPALGNRIPDSIGV